MIALQKMTRALLAVIVMLALMPQPALAAVSCTFDINTYRFGDVDMTQSATFRVDHLIMATCSGGVANDALTICMNLPVGDGGLNSGGTSRTMKDGTAAMEYNFSIAGEEWGAIGGPFTPFRWQVNLNPSGNFNGTRSINARLRSPQRTLPAGAYTDNFTGSTAAKFEYKQGQNDCISIRNNADGTGSASFSATANNIAACTVTATNLNFDKTGPLIANIDAQSTVRAMCTNGLPYDIGLDKGTGGGTASMRRMTNGDKFVSYQMYQDASHTLNWGNTLDSDTAQDTGSGSSQAFTVYGRVPPQTTPAPGTYTDTIIVTVTF